MTKHICAEIEYGEVHSDICGEFEDPEWGKFLHDCLDEWLDNSNGEGIFYVGDIGSFVSTEVL